MDRPRHPPQSHSRYAACRSRWTSPSHSTTSLDKNQSVPRQFIGEKIEQIAYRRALGRWGASLHLEHMCATSAHRSCSGAHMQSYRCRGLAVANSSSRLPRRRSRLAWRPCYRHIPYRPRFPSIHISNSCCLGVRNGIGSKSSVPDVLGT